MRVIFDKNHDCARVFLKRSEIVKLYSKLSDVEESTKFKDGDTEDYFQMVLTKNDEFEYKVIGGEID
ncbi:hypothetical protein [Treponema sp.]|uniref:hypothetical protein n=1 Tax=Treponema sp. TaxID=166 RepID=UPI00298E6B32|nr:hypothetical protein [Treponema sp.]MCQ2242084.1 hypothetical protein [Treponema sp.]MCQ2242126.1 hypothetical protein [Treponema sp.]